MLKFWFRKFFSFGYPAVLPYSDFLFHFLSGANDPWDALWANVKSKIRINTYAHVPGMLKLFLYPNMLEFFWTVGSFFLATCSFFIVDRNTRCVSTYRSILIYSYTKIPLGTLPYFFIEWFSNLILSYFVPSFFFFNFEAHMRFLNINYFRQHVIQEGHYQISYFLAALKDWFCKVHRRASK